MKASKKIMHLGLSALMAASALTCAGGSVAYGQKTEANTNMTPYGKYAQPITITIAKTATTGTKFPEGTSSLNNDMIKAIKEKLNIDVKILWEAEGKDYMNKLSLNIASGDLPDIINIHSNSYLTFKSLVKNNMLADLTESVKLCSGDYIKQIFDSLGSKNLETLTFDGKLMGLGSVNLGYGHNILWLRKDWMDKYKLPLPKNVADIEKILKTFVAEDAGNNGKGKTIGLTLASTPVGGYNNIYGAEPVMHSFGAYPRQWLTDDKGKVFYGSTAPQVKEGLAVLRKWYADGLIDKSFMTKTRAGETDAVIDGNLSGVFFGPWWGIGSRRQELAKAHPESDWVPVNAPLDSQGKFNQLTASPVADFLAVRKGYKNPEALIKILNLEFDYYRGFDAEGAARLKPYLDLGTSMGALLPTGGFNLDFYDVVPRLGAVVKKYVDTKGDESVLKSDPLLTEYDKSQATLAKEYVDKKDVAGKGWKPYYNRYIGSNGLTTPENVIIQSAYYYTTDSSQDLKPSLDKLEDEMYLKIIVGEEPLDYFDKFVKQWKELGGDKLTAEVQKAVDK